MKHPPHSLSVEEQNVAARFFRIICLYVQYSDFWGVFLCAFAFILKILERDAHGGSCSGRQTSDNTADRMDNKEAAGPSSKRSSVT